MSPNPFRFGTPIEGRPLIGRDREREELLRAIKEGRGLALVAPRGMGKTALLADVLKTWRRTGGPAIYVDFLAAVSPRRFAEIYASALTLEPSQTVESMQEAMQQLVPSFMPRVTITGSGRPGLQLDLWDRERDLRAVLQRILDTPNQLATESDKPLALVFDGFEDLLANSESDLLDEFARSIRAHRNVAHFFTLRKETTARDIFGSERTPFYRLAEPVALEAIAPGPWTEGLAPLFAAADAGADAGLLERAVELAEGIPWAVQTICHALVSAIRGAGRAGESELQAALAEVLESHHYGFRAVWDPLSLHQRNLVLAVAQGFTERLHSQRMVFELGLGSPSTVSKNLKTLTDRELLQKSGSGVSFVDPFFGHWLRRRMT
jgi:hypothetical protein